MTQLAASRIENPKNRKHYPFFIGVVAMSTILVALAAFFVDINQSHAAPSLHISSAASSVKDCVSSSSSQWTPVGFQWKLTVTFLQGSRHGQSEVSNMTFLPDGHLTATFPGSTPASPPQLPPTNDGAWCMTGMNAFHYQFRETIQQRGQPVAYVQTSISADLLSATTYEAAGVGIAYSARNGQTIPNEYNLTQTVAKRMSQPAR
jgi:hypothetical protein